MRYIAFIILLLLSMQGFAQVEDPDDFDFQNEISDAEIDSTQWDGFETIDLADIEVYAVRLNTDDEKKYFKWLERRVDDVYPFLQKAVSEYYMVKDSARRITNKRMRKKFIKNRYNQLADQYEDKLKNLTVSRGQILTRLIERETDITAYDMIKELRGGTNAFLWNTAGGAFNIDLKAEFDPRRSREDMYIAVIIQRGIADGKYEEITEKEERIEKLNPILKAFGRN